ncbi:hypothetical protein [Pleomorphomonas carboxyditropha]|uniref:DUF885 domain-containing protein n=1 Tax=Pleomorphomonas carboxyditropha TaxID=2023338 RepID=A0A2G9WPI0_9HYPH|nr:hypothetical protein [Pleomorphomonas carboxyditropha]PIO96617.1 hypothetical protein CJ014_24530 [Pleomorphomonas carboxyditropha]
MRICLIAAISALLPFPAMAGSAVGPNFSDVWGAAWRQESTIGAFLADKMRYADPDTLDPAFDAWQASEGTDYQHYPEQLGRLLNRQAYEAWKAQFEMEREDRRMLEFVG